MPNGQTDNLGSSGENALITILTGVKDAGNNYIFRPAFLGDKWPAKDLYVELISDEPIKPYFFVQVKTTERDFLSGPKRLPIRLTRRDEERLLGVPAPTYLVAVKPGRRLLGHKAYIRAIYERATHAISYVKASCELNERNLMRLRDEVVNYWSDYWNKPDSSAFRH